MEDLYTTKYAFKWPDATITFKTNEANIDFGEKMTNPTVTVGDDSGWSSLGADYNWFDRQEAMAGLELRLPLDDTTRGYYDYLVNTQTSVYSGSNSITSQSRRPGMESVAYTDCTITEDTEPEPSPSPSPDDSDTWIYVLVGGAVLASIIVCIVLFICVKRRNKRREEAAIAYQ